MKILSLGSLPNAGHRRKGRSDSSGQLWAGSAPLPPSRGLFGGKICRASAAGTKREWRAPERADGTSPVPFKQFLEAWNGGSLIKAETDEEITAEKRRIVFENTSLWNPKATASE